MDNKLLLSFQQLMHGRSYDTQVEATGAILTRKHSHIRPRGFDIPMVHESYLLPKIVLSGGVHSHMENNTQNLVLSAADTISES